MPFEYKISFDSKGFQQQLETMFGPGSDAQAEWSRIVFDGSVPYMPMLTGTLRNLSKAHSATSGLYGELVYPGPYAHYLWMGELYVDPETGKGAFFSEDYGYWSRPGVTKVASGRKLDYDKAANPLAGAKWVERAANDNMPAWVAEMQGLIDGGYA